MIGLAVSLAVHLILLCVLLLAVRGHAPDAEEPSIVVSLTHWLAPHAKPAPPPRQPLAPHRTPLPAATIQPSPIPLPPPKALDPNGPIDPRLAAQEAMGQALRDTVQCAHADQSSMTADEREHCRQFNSRMGRDAPTYDVNIDDHARHDPPMASHGTAAHIGPPPPFPGTPLNSPRTCEHTWCEHPDERRGP